MTTWDIKFGIQNPVDLETPLTELLNILFPKIAIINQLKRM